MSTTKSWGLIGFGNIGHEVIRQLAQPSVAKRLGLQTSPVFIADTKGVLQPDGQPSTLYKSYADINDFPEVMFVAIPSSNDGAIAHQYIVPLLEKGVTVITSEKGAAANYFAELKAKSNNFEKLGISATVGGGTRLLSVAREYCQDIDNITEIHLALNGTLAAILSWVAPLHGATMPLAEAVQQAVELGYAEPGSKTPGDVIRAEAEGDIPKKAAIFCNSLGLSSRLIDWRSLQFTLSDADITKAVDTAQPRRFIVSLYSPLQHKVVQPSADIVGGFTLDHDGWHIVGGFQRVDANSLFKDLANLTGPGNGMVIGLGPEADDGIYAVTGPGAGVHPTVNAMIDDYLRLKRLSKQPR